jgi:hypothetical protein
VKSLLTTGVFCSAIGLAVGVLVSSGGPAAPSFQVENHTVHRAAGSQGLGRAELASIVRQELARERTQSPALAQSPPPIETVEQARERMSDEELEHADHAARVLRGAVSRGQWTLEDRSALVAQIAKLPAAVQAEIGGQLAVALNKGELKMEGDWLPL